MKNFLAIDIGGSGARIHYQDINSVKRSDVNFTNDNSNETSFLEFIKGIDTFSECYGINEVGCISIASAPNINFSGEISCWPNQPSWEGINIAKEINRLINGDLIIEDDCAAAAYGESKIRGVSDLVYIGLGTGTGCGIMKDNELISKRDKFDLEIGHTIVELDSNMLCVCGRRGCLQSYVSSKNVLDVSHSLATRKSNKALSQKIIDVLSLSIINLNEIFSINNFVLGGGLSVRFSDLISGCQIKVNSLARPKKEIPQIYPSYFSGDSSLQGAVMMANDYLNSRDFIKQKIKILNL